MANRFKWFLFLVIPLFAACQSEPRTEYVIEITREVTREVTVVVVVTATPRETTTDVTTGQAQANTDAPAPTATVPTATSTPTPTPEPSATPEPTIDPRPTTTVNRVIVAEQLFERGRMFYVQPVDQIWVMIENGDPNTGPWRIEENTWNESLPENDPSLEPPEEGLVQPIRGFGKLWRENEELRQALGWATEDEVGRVATYQYVPGGTVSEQGEYIPGPGVHTLDSHYGGTYLFDENTQTWGLAATSES